MEEENKVIEVPKKNNNYKTVIIFIVGIVLGGLVAVGILNRELNILDKTVDKTKLNTEKTADKKVEKTETEKDNEGKPVEKGETNNNSKSILDKKDVFVKLMEPNKVKDVRLYRGSRINIPAYINSNNELIVRDEEKKQEKIVEKFTKEVVDFAIYVSNEVTAGETIYVAFEDGDVYRYAVPIYFNDYDIIKTKDKNLSNIVKFDNVHVDADCEAVSNHGGICGGLYLSALDKDGDYHIIIDENTIK